MRKPLSFRVSILVNSHEANTKPRDLDQVWSQVTLESSETATSSHRPANLAIISQPAYLPSRATLHRNCRKFPRLPGTVATPSKISKCRFVFAQAGVTCVASSKRRGAAFPGATQL